MGAFKVLLTGGRGFVGSAVLRRLLSDGAEVVMLGRAPVPGLEHRQVDLLDVDRTTLTRLVEKTGCDVLIHAAWYTNHSDYLTAAVNRAWLESSTRLFEAFHEVRAGRMAGIGTCAEYALESGRCTEGKTPLRPATLYGQCKKALSERLLALPHALWTRIFFVYGPGDRTGRLVPRLIELASAGQPVSVRYGGLKRDYIHVDDLATEIVALTASDYTGAVNTGTGRAARLSQIADAVAEAAGRPELAEPNDRIDPAQPRVIEADMERYWEAVGPVACRSLLDGLTALVQGSSTFGAADP